MHRQRLALGLGICLLVGTSLSVLPWHGKETGIAPSVYEGVGSPLPLVLLGCRSQYPQPKLLEHRQAAGVAGDDWVIISRYTHFVQSFLESAEEFFMRGYRVHYYIFTDDPAAIPPVPLGPHRLLSTIPIQGHSHWEEISTRRMETISQHIAKRAHREVDYLFCLDVDMVFRNPWGPETLGDLVAAIHPGYYAVPRQQFPYERRRVSAAFVADSEGDFYYGGAVFGGQVARVYEFTRSCHMAILADKANGIMAAWQEESHLNRHFISNKPSKVLSPEYLWDDRKPQPPSLKLIRFSTLDKDISCLRS
uniref:N-acetyllactosaminide alpha-1,3-galactosyltransferase n=1 Tax=Aotus nancymaae TaxID=37293 RepID=A0A2K5EEW9_AOTNA